MIILQSTNRRELFKSSWGVMILAEAGQPEGRSESVGLPVSESVGLPVSDSDLSGLPGS